MEYKKLDELLEYIQPTKYIVDSENYDDSFPTPVLTAGKSFILGYTDETNGIYFASKENPIILFDDFTTECKLVDFAFKVKSSACKILKPKKDINIKYVYYAMKNIDIDTALHKRYWISIYSQQTIPFPIPIIQENIVSEIEVINETIEYNEHKIKYLEELIKSQFIEMFGDVLRNTKNFEMCCFGEYVNQMNIGPFGSDLKNEDFVPEEEGYCMVYEQKHAIQKNIDLENRFVNEVKYNKLKRFDIGPGDIIVSCRGTIGECYILPNDAPNGIIHPSLMMIKPKNIVNNKFLVFLLEHILDEQTEQGSGVKMAIKATELSKIKTIKPEISLQDQFIDFVQQIDKSKLIVQQEIKLLNELLEVKMNEYFS